MSRTVKIVLIAFAAVLAVVTAVVAFVAATFDPNAYKPQIIQAVKDKTQRTLKLEGDIRLAFWPSIGARIGRASLSERGSEREFASVEEAQVAVKLIPLLSKQVIVDGVELRGLRASLVRSRDGKSNIDDLAGGGAPVRGEQPAAPAPVVDIARIVIQDAALSYRDEAAGTQITLSGLDLKTGRLASGVPSNLELSVKARANQPKLELDLKAKGGFLFDLEKQHYAVDGMKLEAKGEAAGISKLDASLNGSVSVRPGAGEVTAEKLVLAATGVQAGNNLELKAEAPRLTLTADKASGEKLTVVAKVTGATQTLVAQLALPGVEGTAQAFRTGPMSLDLDLKRGELAVKAKASSPLSGNLQAKQIALPKLALNLSASGPDLPGKTLSGQLQGSAAVDGAREAAQASLAGRVGDSNLKAKLAVNGFARPAFGFDIDIDQLDLDKYLPPRPVAAKAPAGAAPATPATPAREQPLDLSALKGLNATGSLRIGSLKVQNIKSSNVRLDVTAKDGRVDFNPVSANLYQGTLSGSATVNAAGIPSVAARQNLNGVNIAPLLKDAANFENLEGRGNVALDVTTQGATAGAMKKALNGTAAIHLADGAYRGINIAETIRTAKAALGAVKGKPQAQTQAANTSQKTDFTEMKASFQIRNGVAHNEDLSMKSPLLRLAGAGDIDIGNDAINYLARATVVSSSKGQGGAEADQLKSVTVPVKLTGPLGAPKYEIDYGALATEAAKQEVEKKAGEFLQRKLPGLFGK
ncbi:MAG TPA: AsmA family protein [Burkholderiales bacterium]|nr:AsmA family protein [Burkholderiales bacterium]